MERELIYETLLKEIHTSLFKHDNHFCLIWKSNGFNFNQAIENKSKPNFKVVDNVESDKFVKSLIKKEHKPKKVQSPLTNINVHDLETFIKVRAVPYCSCIYKLSKISGKYIREKSEQDYHKCLNVCVVFKGTDCINELLDYVLSFKGNQKKSITRLLNIIFIW